MLRRTALYGAGTKSPARGGAGGCEIARYMPGDCVLNPAPRPAPWGHVATWCDTLAAELGVKPNELGEALRSFVERKKAIADCQTKSLPQRAAEAERNWRTYKTS